MAEPKISNQETYVEPKLELSGPATDPLSTQLVTDDSQTICGCCFC